MTRYVKTALFALLLGLAGLLASAVCGYYGFEEKAGLCLLFKIRGERQPPESVLVAAMDREAIRTLGLAREAHKWPRDLHGRLVDVLAQGDPGVIAFDVIFDEAKDPDRDAALAAAIASAGNVVLCEHVQKETLTMPGAGGKTTTVSVEKRSQPIDRFARPAVGSGPFPLPKRPVRVGQIWLFKPGGEDIPTLPVVAFQTWALTAYDAFLQTMARVQPDLAAGLPSDREAVLVERVDAFVTRMRVLFRKTDGLGDAMGRALENGTASSEEKAIIRSLVNLYDGQESRYLNFYGPSGSIHTHSYSDILDPAAPGGPAGDFTGKAIFIGRSDTRQVQESDVFFTVFSTDDGIDLSGVEIAATAFANLLTDSWVSPLESAPHIFLVFCWGLLVGTVCFLLRPMKSAGLVVLACVGYGATAQVLFNRWGLWLPMVVPLFFQGPAALLGGLLVRYANVKKERQNIRKAFGRYLPEKVVGRLASDLGGLGRENRLVYGVCLFTDACQYTQLAEEMDPMALRELMNRYYEITFSPVTARDGFVSDVVGDAMLALWTGTSPDRSMAVSACRAALEIAAGIEKFKNGQGAAYLPTRMGIHAGYVSLGDIGAGGHFEYRAVGDMVNTASRIEALNKELGTTILISSEVSNQLKGFVFRPKGEFLLKGKTNPVTIFELVSEGDE
jgi:adenylate cyclase